jgi:cephalosporin-C deacetylase
MACADMPLEHLKKYEGRNPRPADFDAFWDASLAEMHAIDPAPVFTPFTGVPSKIADFFELTFTSTKGARIYAKFAKPKHIEGKAPALLLFHGLSSASDSWHDLLPFVSQGFVVAAMDCRGQGGKTQDLGGTLGTTFSSMFLRGIEGDPNDMYYRDVFLDTAMLARVVMGLDYVDETRVATHGASQGGGLAVVCAALMPEIRMCVPIVPFLSDYKRVWEMGRDVGAYEGLHYYFRRFDPTHAREDEIFTKLGYIDVQHFAPRVRAKVLFGSGLMDTTCPPSTHFAVYNKLTSEKELAVYPDFGHEEFFGFLDIVFTFLSELCE